MIEFYVPLLILSPVSAMAEIPVADDDDMEGEIIELECGYSDKGAILKGPHRTPPRIPSVYFSRSTNKLLFVEPMGECIIELVDTDTEDTVFTLPIMNGITQVQLPLLSTGQYQLRIIRSVYMFSGIIEF